MLFQIDPAPFQYKVTPLQASLAAARQQVEILKSNYEQATANVSGLTAQAAYNKKRLADIETLAADMANTEFQAQDKQVEYIFSRPDAEWSGCAKNTHVFRLFCKIPIINLSLPARGVAMMKAAR